VGEPLLVPLPLEELEGDDELLVFNFSLSISLTCCAELMTAFTAEARWTIMS